MITIRTEKESITLKLTEEESREKFWELVSILKGQKSLGGGEPLQETAARENPVYEAVGPEPIQESGAAAGYTGFLHIQCPECGEISSFCAKKPIKEYTCKNCGAHEKLENLTSLYVDCECGRHSIYRTNRPEEMFDIACIDCGAPVAVEWNDKKGIYQTIKQGAI